MSETMTLVPVATPDIYDDAGIRNVLGQLEQARTAIADADPESLLKIWHWAQAVDAVAKAKEALDVSVEAAIVRVTAERRLGEVLAKFTGERSPITIETNVRRMCIRLSELPQDLFDRLCIACRENKGAASSRGMLWAARAQTLKRVEPGISRAWDGSCSVRLRSGDTSRWRKNLEEARELVAELTGLKTEWANNPVRIELDDAYSRARKFSLALDLLIKSVEVPEARRFVAEALHAQMQVAELLHKAFVETRIAERQR